MQYMVGRRLALPLAFDAISGSTVRVPVVYKNTRLSWRVRTMLTSHVPGGGGGGGARTAEVFQVDLPVSTHPTHNNAELSKLVPCAHSCKSYGAFHVFAHA